MRVDGKLGEWFGPLRIVFPNEVRLDDES